jgi:hypothetical protein
MLTTILIWILCGFIPILIGRIVTKQKEEIYRWIIWTLLGPVTLALFLVGVVLTGLVWLIELDYSWLEAWLTKKV